MTVNATQTFLQIPGNGSATVFSFPFLITTATDLIVGFIVGGVYTQQLSGYTVSGIGNPGGGPGGGQVTFTTPPPSGTTVDLRSLLALTQPTNFANLGAYLPEQTTSALDRIERNIQDLTRLAYTFGIHGPDSEIIPWAALPPPLQRLGATLIFDPVTGLPGAGPVLTTALTQALFNSFLASATFAPTIDVEVNPANNIGMVIDGSASSGAVIQFNDGHNANGEWFLGALPGSNAFFGLTNANTVIPYFAASESSLAMFVFEPNYGVGALSAIATQSSGSFTGTFSGFASPVTATILWWRNGNVVSMALGAVTGLSNLPTMTMTGIPFNLIPPSQVQSQIIPLIDNGVQFVGEVNIIGSTLTFARGSSAGLSASGFTASGLKGMANAMFQYVLA